jgi:hypothetical protein
VSTSQSGNSVTRIEPPKYALPNLESGMGRTEGAYQQGGPQQYQGNTVVPFAPQTEQAFGMIQDRATNGSPVSDAASNLAVNTLNGGFLNSNPFLDSMFDRAAGAVQNRISSQFGQYGRDVSSSLPFQQQGMNDLATQIYGGNYDAERNRMMQMLPYQQSIANQPYQDAAMLRGVGSEVEGMAGRVIGDNTNRWNFEQQRPELALDSFLSRSMGNTMGQTQKTPEYSNPAMGALGGALGGAQLGSMFGPWGTGIGAIGGGLLGLFG